MDYNVNTSTTSPSVGRQSKPHANTASTPTAVILARNIQKFFQAKSDLLAGAKSSSPGNRRNKNNDSNSSDLDVPTVLKDIDEILESRTVEDGKLLLRGMVADLLKEVDLLRFRGDATAAQLATVKEERDVVNNDYRDRLVSLLRALQQHTDATGQTVHGQALIQQRLALQNASNNENATSSNSSSKLLTPDEATMLTIQSLTRKIERLNVETTDLTDQLARSRERNEDLESINAAQEYKIAALEKQFSSINQKRNKVVSSHILQAQAATTATATSTSVTKSVSTTAKSTTHTKSSGSSSSSYKTFVPPKLQKEKENIPPTSSSSSSQHATVSAALALIKTPTSSSSSTTEPYKKVVVVSPTDASPVSSTSSHRDTTISTESSTNLTLKERGMYAAKRPKSRLSSSTRLVKLVDQM